MSMTLTTLFTPIMPSMITAQQHVVRVIMLATPSACAAKPDAKRPMKLQEFRITNYEQVDGQQEGRTTAVRY